MSIIRKISAAIAALCLGAAPSAGFSATASVSGVSGVSGWSNGSETFCQVQFSGSIKGENDDNTWGRDRYLRKAVNTAGTSAMASGSITQGQVKIGKTDPVFFNVDMDILDAGSTVSIIEAMGNYVPGAVLASYVVTQADMDYINSFDTHGCLSPDQPDEDQDVTASVLKSCDPLADTGSDWSTTCRINVTPPSSPQAGRFLFVTDTLTNPGGAISADVITGLTAAGFDCRPAAAPYAALQTPSCMIEETDLPAGGLIVNVDVALPKDAGGTWTNCADLGRVSYDGMPPSDPFDIHHDFGSDDTGPAAETLGQSCAEMVVPVVSDPPDDVDPLQCMPFTPQVECNGTTGQWQVSLQNSLSGKFDPNMVTVTSLTPGVHLQSSPANPLIFDAVGAGPGDTVRLTTEAVAQGAGLGTALDLCCMGEMEVTIPQGEICEVRDPEVVLDVTKTCELREDLNFGTTSCTFKVHYEGPPPTANAPITVTDTMMQTPWTYEGLTAWSAGHGGNSSTGWACGPSEPYSGPQPVSCSIDASRVDASQDWSNWDSEFTLDFTTPDQFRNCADASASGGADQSCHTIGDYDLEIVKQLADGQDGMCHPGKPCEFVYIVSNTSTFDYSGPITLTDSPLVNGTLPGGSIIGMTPPLCSDIADLTNGAGCTGNVTVPAGGSTSFTVDYLAPALLAEGPTLAQGENCVALTDQSMTDGTLPGEDNGKLSCAEFQVGNPVIELTKTKDGTCLPETDCTFTIELRTNSEDFDGRIALYEMMTGNAQGGTITAISGSPNAVPADCLPLANPAACVMDLSLPPNSVQTFTVTAQHFFGVDGLYDMENCAVAQVVPPTTPLGAFDLNDPSANPIDAASQSNDDALLGRACVPLDTEEPPTGDGEIVVTKAFNQVECSVGGACDFTLTLTNVSTTDSYAGPVAISDSDDLAGGLQISAVTPPVCLPAPTATPFDCVANVNLAPGASLDIVVSAYKPLGTMASDDSTNFENCVQGANGPVGDIGDWPADLFNETQEACVQSFMCGFACHMNSADAEMLTVDKVLLNPGTCVPGGVCTYRITVANTDFTPVTSPLTLSETLPVGGTIAAIRALPWSCGPGANNTTECAHPPITLNPGDTTSFELDVAIPADFAGDEIGNCVSFAVNGGAVAGAMARARAGSPLLMLSRPGGPSEGDLAAYLKARGMPAPAATQRAASLAPRMATVGASGAARQGGGDASCAVKTLGDDLDHGAARSTPSIDVEKTCLNMMGNAPHQMDCTITVTGSGLPPGETILISDELTQYTNNTPDPASLNSTVFQAPTGFSCLPNIGGVAAICSGSTDALAALGGTAVIHIVGQANSASGEDDYRNCVAAGIPGRNDNDCVQFVDGVAIDPDTFFPDASVTKSCQVTRVSDGVQPHQVTCDLQVTATQPFTGVLEVHDSLTNATLKSSRIVSVFMPSATQCLQPPYADNADVDCEVQGANFPASLSDIMTVVMEFDPGVDDGPGNTWENCAHGPLLNQSCVDIVLPAVTPPAPDYSVSKTCLPPVPSYYAATDGWKSTCTLTLGITGQGNGMFDLRDSFLPTSPAAGAIVDVRPPSGDWACTYGPYGTAGGSEVLCNIDTTLLPANSTHQVEVDVFLSDLAGTGGQRAENCAHSWTPGVPQACVQIDVPTVTPPAVPVLDLAKTCVPTMQNVAGPTDYTCTITLSGADLPSGRTIRIMDFARPGAAFDHVSVAMDQGAGLSGCVLQQPSLAVFPYLNETCEISSDALMAQPGGVLNIPVAGALVDAQHSVQPPEPGNCVNAVMMQADGTTPQLTLPPVCADIDVTPAVIVGTPVGPEMLSVSKALVGECRVDKAAQVYGCDFELSLRNDGAGDYSGPAVLNDAFGTPAPRKVEAKGEGWECLRSDGKGVSCLNGGLKLAPGAETRVQMSLVLPGLRRGGSFDNCVSVGIGDSRFQQALVVQSVMQKLGIDGGPVDGAPGRKTRAGIRQLQERLGQDQTGELTPELFAALGVPMAAEAKPACVSAPLPPMPVVCKPGQKVNSAGACFWPKCPDGQVRNTKGQCYTPKPDDCRDGQKRNSAGKCYWPKCPDGQKRNSRGICYVPEGPKCDSRSTVLRGGDCACRYKGMRKVTPRSCICRNTGLPPVRGVGCPSIKIKRGDGDAVGDSKKNCLVINGLRICN